MTFVKLEIEQQHPLGRGRKLKRLYGDTGRDALGDLNGENALALPRIGKEDAQLAFVPKIAEKGSLHRDLCRVAEPGIGRFCRKNIIDTVKVEIRQVFVGQRVEVVIVDGGVRGWLLVVCCKDG